MAKFIQYGELNGHSAWEIMEFCIKDCTGQKRIFDYWNNVFSLVIPVDVLSEQTALKQHLTCVSGLYVYAAIGSMFFATEIRENTSPTEQVLYHTPDSSYTHERVRNPDKLT